MKSAFLIIAIIISIPAVAQWTTGSSLIYYNGGNVGVGTTTPSSKLDVFEGDIRISATTANRALIFDASSSTNLASLISMRRSNVVRWQFGATGGSGVDNFDFFRYSDTGAFLGSAIRIERATGPLESMPHHRLLAH